MKNRFAIINNELVYVLAGTFASDAFIEKGDFGDVSGRSFSYLNPETGKAECCDRSKVQLDANSVDIKISPIIKKCQELVEEGYEIFGEYFIYSHYCKVSKHFGEIGKFANFSVLKVWKDGKTFKTIYLHDSLRGDNEVFSEEIEIEEIPEDANLWEKAGIYFVFL